ncbi:MAG TPA: protein-L-isoaspartate(D-aspartate) O-methyltransferase [Pirellulales bacterium]|nr:protein-L-isoaspartate(D-aspartate) O-methyltransferase [Pirellulales bacterium]
MSKNCFRVGMLCLAVGSLAARPLAAENAAQWFEARQRMVDEYVVAAGVTNARVITAMRSVPRHEFVTPDQRPNAYFEMCLPIGEGQTISYPFMVASMTERIAPVSTDRVLEVGTGSGYQAAVLSGLVKDVYTIEIVEKLGRRAAHTLRRLGYRNVHTRIGDGYQGWPQAAPFDKIIVTCSPEAVPQPLVDQLKEGGRLIIPVGERYQQTLYLFKKEQGELAAEAIEPTMFVPMTGVAEDERAVKPDPARPTLVNGSFEQLLPAGDHPAGWYYVRQGVVASHPGAPDGDRYLLLSNSVPGRFAQAFQALGVAGEWVAELDVSLMVRTRGIHTGQSEDQLPRFYVTFFDAERAPIGQGQMGPWPDDSEWTRKTCRMKVPRAAYLAVATICMEGSTGEMAVDDLRIRPVLKENERPKLLSRGRTSN